MNDKNGYTLVEGLLILLVICVVGFAGWFVWDKSRVDDTAQQTSSPAETINSLSAVAEGWVKYEGDGFTFAYPNQWDQLNEDEWPYNVRLVKSELVSEAKVGGGLGAIIVFDMTKNTWVIDELGRFSGDYKIGDEIQLSSVTSDDDVVVYFYTEADGPFSSTKLLFITKQNIVTIQMPVVCKGECTPESTYDSAQIEQLSNQIAKTVVVN